MAKKNRDYWSERFKQIEQIEHGKGVKCYADIEKLYQKAQRQIEAQIEAWYGRFATNNGITLEEARKWLSAKQLAELKWDVQEYIQHGQANAINKQWMTQLENASARYHISRLESLKIQMQQQVEDLFGNEMDMIDQTIRSSYKDSFYRAAFEIQKGIGVGWDFGTIDDGFINKTINKPWTKDGKNFSSRIWTNKQMLVNELNTTLTRGIITGQDPQKIIDVISSRMKTSKNNAGRLVMTEQAFFSETAQHDSFTELGVDLYEIVATLDSHTSEICQDMDGKVFHMSQWEVGVTAPPFHVLCRSTTVPSFNDEFDLLGERAARAEDGEPTYYIPANMTYKDWQKAFVDGDKSGLNKVQPDDTIKSKASPDDKTTQVIKDAIPSSLQQSKDFYDTWNQSKIKDFAQQHLNNIGLRQFKVNMRNMKGASGACYGSFNVNQPIHYTEYRLRSTDPRTMPYRVKTALHESYHLKAHGLLHDRPKHRKMSGYAEKDWKMFEETFTECSAHYMADCIGVPHTAPSYADYLIEILPKLKQGVSEFAKCQTISDFGKVAYKFRFGTASEVTASWESIYIQTRSIKHDVIDYAMQYISYIKAHKDDLIKLAHEQMMAGGFAKSDIEYYLNNVLDRIDNLASGDKLKLNTGNEQSVFNNILINAMDLEGVK